jgi:prepilin-type processing-associated H-X9-DG protein
MVRIEGAPMVIEEDPWHSLLRSGLQQSDWSDQDCLADRHLKTNGKGRGTVGFVDGHVDSLLLRPLPKTATSWGEAQKKGFVAGSLCVRSSSGKWVDVSDSKVDNDPYGCFMEVRADGQH